MRILVLNAGSSSQKSCLYDLTNSPEATLPQPLWEAHLDWTVAQTGILTVKSNDTKQKIEVTDRDIALQALLDTLIQGETKVLNSLDELDVVGHRVVHGGAKYSQATIIDSEVKQAISDLIPLAPNHNPAHLKGIETISQLLPQVPQVAVFDTAFHQTIPEVAKVYPLPYQWYNKGIQRYGFHGISHQYCSLQAAEILQHPLESLKIVTCHLGNGCSLAAITDGICIDTTMGFSPLEGLMMGTRCGSIDPQIPLYMMQEYNLSIDAVNHILNKESGLKGVSGIAADLRTILAARDEGNSQAQLAFELYLHYLKKAIATMIASLNGIDVLVFTAGVGENSAIVRQKACEELQYLGLELDITKNNSRPVNENIATPNSTAQILVIHTQEDWAIAQTAKQLVQSKLT